MANEDVDAGLRAGGKANMGFGLQRKPCEPGEVREEVVDPDAKKESEGILD